MKEEESSINKDDKQKEESSLMKEKNEIN